MVPSLRRYYDEILAREKGTILKDPGGKITFCLVFPNHYRTAISNLGYQFVYALLNSHRDVLCERAFLPEREVIEEHRRTSTPLVSLEGRRPLRDFHVVAFSLSYENDYPNCLLILDLAGIPLLSDQRGPYDPLVIAGGAAISANPEPMAPFFDCILVGEGEEVLGDFLEALRRNWGAERGELLRALAQVRGVYVPSLYEPVFEADGTLRGIYPRTGGIPERVEHPRARKPPAVLSAPLVTPLGEFGNAVLVEVARGCPFRCKFCVVKALYDPFRPWPWEELRAAAKEAVRRTGRVGLLGAAIGSHPRFPELCRAIVEEGGTFSLSSLRADRVTPEVADALASSGQRTVTLAPETGSESLRFRIGKEIPDEAFLEAAEVLAERGIMNLRLYFMVGLPGAAEDAKAIAKLVRAMEARQRARSRGKRGQITVTLSPFVPKPWTPYQWYPFAGIRAVRGQMEEVKRALKGIRVHHDLPKWAYWEACFSLGDRRLGLALLEGYRRGNWMEGLRKGIVNPDFWALRDKGKEEPFPWEILLFPFGREALWERRD